MLRPGSCPARTGSGSIPGRPRTPSNPRERTLLHFREPPPSAETPRSSGAYCGRPPSDQGYLGPGATFFHGLLAATMPMRLKSSTSSALGIALLAAVALAAYAGKAVWSRHAPAGPAE